MSAPHELDACTARRLMRAGELSPVELVTDLQARADALGEGSRDGINAFTEQLLDEALEQARRAEQTYAAHRRSGDGPDELPRLLGLPVATKEKHGLAGHSLTQGLLVDASVVAERDHPVVERIRAAGGIVHARTTSPEFSCATVTHSPMWGVTRNPWNLAASPGGSSGGAGAALAARTTPLATASDIAGSTRVPAGFTGTVGYKAPYGRVPGLPPLSLDPYRGDGPMARTVADCALLAGVMSGRHAADHTSWGTSCPPIDEAGLVRAVDDLAGRRVGLSVTLGDQPVDPEVADRTRAVADLLTRAGATVVDIELPWDSEQVRRTIFAHFGHILGPAMRARLADDGGAVDGSAAAYTRRFIEDCARAAARDDLVTSLGLDATMQAQLAHAMAGLDVLLCPTNAVTHLAADGDYLDGVDIQGRHLPHYWGAHLTSPFNVANRHPVLAVPSGQARNGVPTGVQVVAQPFDERTALSVGAAIEALRPAMEWPT